MKKYIESFHPNTNGGRAILLAKDCIAKKDYFLATTILRGLDLDVTFRNIKSVTFTETIKRGGIDQPVIIVNCTKKYGQILTSKCYGTN